MASPALSESEKADIRRILTATTATLPANFIVSQVLPNDLFPEAPGSVTQSGSKVVVRVHRADGAKCERCWNYSTRVGENTEWPTVCERCVAALEEIKSYGESEATGQSPEASGRGAS